MRVLFINCYFNIKNCMIKVAVCKFCCFVASLFENLELQLCAELFLCVGLYSGTAPALMNLMF